jgi:hypothetical protein
VHALQKLRSPSTRPEIAMHKFLTAAFLAAAATLATAAVPPIDRIRVATAPAPSTTVQPDATATAQARGDAVQVAMPGFKKR